MGFFFKLFAKKKNILEDSVFGKIEYRNGIWTNIPDDLKSRFMVTISASESGPSEIQKLFFQVLKNDLNEYEKLAKEFIAFHVSKTIDVGQLGIYSIEIGGEAETIDNSFIIELSDELAIEIHRIQFKNKEPIHYGIDD